MKVELSKKTIQRTIDALEDENIILQRKVLSLKEILNEINVLKRSIIEKNAEIATLKHYINELDAVKRNIDLLVESIKIDIGSCPYEGWAGEYIRIHITTGKTQ